MLSLADRSTATIGGFVSLFGLVSYLLKERFHLSEACMCPAQPSVFGLVLKYSVISLLVGITFSHGTKFLKPLEYAFNDEENLRAITLYFARLVLGVQLVLAGIQLPSKYLLREWKSLALLLGPGMTVMWVSSSLLIWGLVPNLSFLHALAMGACVTPTDPVLSNSIVKGRFADQNIPKDLQNLIIAESGANDGLGYPFLFFALYIIKYVNDGGAGQPGGARLAMGYWFGETWGYTILLSVVYGAAVGWLAKELLHFAEEKNYVDRESFLVFAISLAVSHLYPWFPNRLLTRNLVIHNRNLWLDRERRCIGLLHSWQLLYLRVSIDSPAQSLKEAVNDVQLTYSLLQRLVSEGNSG